MGPTSLIPLFCSLLIVASASAFDILQILKSETDDFTTFAKLLTNTKLVNEINSRQTITVLALNNGAVGAITSLPSNLQKEVLSLHVILDYYDPVKLDALKQKTVLLTTLFQSSGQATGQMGFLNYTELPNEKQVFGSAVPGAPLDSNLIGVVAARPYNISVIQVSKAIIPPGLDGAGKAPPPTPSAQSNSTSPTPPSNATSPTPANATKPPTPSSGNATAPSSGNATTPSPKSAPTPSGSKTAPPPKESADSTASNDASPPTDSKANPPTQAASPTEAPSGSATEAPTTAGGPAEANGTATDASSPVSTDVSDAPMAGGPTAGVPPSADSDKTSAADTVVARSTFGLVAMGLVLIGAL